MKYVLADITVVFPQGAILPTHKGSLLRGAFGWALKKAVCTSISRECPQCLLYRTCLYPTVFDPPPTLAGGKDHLPPSPPPPYVLTPEATSKTYFATGEGMSFTLMLFGKACEYIPYFIHAITIMGENGLGPKRDGRRAPFLVASVCWNGESIYDAAENTLNQIPVPSELTLPSIDTSQKSLNGQESSDDIFTVRCISPLRFKVESKLSTELPFTMLIRLILRRSMALFGHYGEGYPEVDSKFLFEQAEKVRAVQSSMYWVDVERYSSRQQTAMKLGGLLGSVTYQGNYTFWKPWLDTAMLLHLGKQTAFGYGCITVEK